MSEIASVEMELSKCTKVLETICQYLDPKSLGMVSFASKNFWKVSIQNQFWKIHTLCRFDEYKGFNTPPDEPDGSWKERFSRKTLQSPTIADIVRGNRDTAIYTCRNYHPYLLGDCLLPIELLKCGVCGEITGGMVHKLCPGNLYFGPLRSLRFPHAPQRKIRVFDLEELLLKHGDRFLKTSGIDYLTNEEMEKFKKFQKFL